MTADEPELVAALRPVVTAFEALDIPYCVGGSIASGVFGEPRQTLDADLVAAVLGAHVDPLAERLQDRYYVDAPMMRRAIAAQSSFNLIPRGSAGALPGLPRGHHSGQAGLVPAGGRHVGPTVA